MAFTQIRFLESPKTIFRYRSGLTTYDEILLDGRLIGRYWNATGFVDKEWIADDIFNLPFSGIARDAFDLEIDGQSLTFGWKFVRFIEVEPNIHSVLELENEIRPIRLRVHTWLDGSPVLTRWLEIVNLASAPAAMSKLSPWAGVLSWSRFWQNRMAAEREGMFSLGYFAEDVSCREGDFQWMTLPKGTFTLGSTNGRSGHGSPFFVLRNEALGTTFVGSLGWSANWKIDFRFEKNSIDGDSCLAFRAGPDAPGPMRVLSPNETLESPKMHLGCLNGGLDQAVQAMHDHIRRSVMPPQPAGREFRVVYNHWGYTAHELSEEVLFHEIDVAAEVGAELFIVDAGWYADKDTEWWQTVGDWKEGNRLAHGLNAIGDYAHKKGLLFGLWCEIERAGKLSQLAINHPDWFLQRDGKPINTALDLTKPEVAEYVESNINRLVQHHHLDLFRLDYNISVGQGGQTRRDGFAENTLYRHCEAIYGIFDRLRAKFPNLLLENCSSGGGRTDLGLVSRFHHTWVTDWQIAPRCIRIFNGMSMALPPEYVDRNCGVGQNAHMQGDLGFQTRSCMLGHFTLSGIYPTADDRNPEQVDFVTHCVSVYKDFIRPMLPESKIYHHTPVLEGQDPHGWCIIELASKNADRAVCGVFRLAWPSDPDMTVKFRGLIAGKTYNLTFDNSGFIVKMSGMELMQKGLAVRLDSAMTSELILVESV